MKVLVLCLIVSTAIATLPVDLVVPEEETALNLVQTVVTDEEASTLLQATTGWKLGDNERAGLEYDKLWPPETCWRPSYKRDKKTDACKSGYVNVGGKMCRIMCPLGWVTCGLRPDKGLMCGQSKKDCSEAKFEMFSSVVSSIGAITGLVVTSGGSSAISIALKIIEIYDSVKQFIDTIKIFKAKTGLMEKLATAVGAGGVVAAINEIVEISKKIDDLKATEKANNQNKDSDISKYRRRMIVMVSKFVGQDLLALLDPTGIAGVVTAFVKPKCIENTNYLWFNTELPEDLSPSKTFCAREKGSCQCTGTITYGADGKFFTKEATTPITSCTNSVFGDPIKKNKDCFCTEAVKYTTTVGVNIEGRDTMTNQPVIAADGTDCEDAELGGCGGGKTNDDAVDECKIACNTNPNCIGFVSHPWGAMMKTATAMVCANNGTQYASYKWWQKETSSTPNI